VKWCVSVAKKVYEMAAKNLVQTVKGAYPVGTRLRVRAPRGEKTVEVIGHDEAWWHRPGRLRVRNVKTLAETNCSLECIIDEATNGRTPRARRARKHNHNRPRAGERGGEVSECKDHGADEAPWMCECTREKLAAMTAERDLLRNALDDVRTTGGGCPVECEIHNGQACADIAVQALKGTPYEHINGRVLVLTAERDHNYGRLQAALSQLADVEAKRAEVVAELAEARRQIDALATLFSDCGDCSICPVETGSRRACDQAECIAAVKEWSLAEARKGRQEAQP